ncbi:MAG: YfhO family protein, partial [Lachnospiraceae bacterium]|nr:YfhO family protein [Lachnospiraceae bacterium]
MKKKVPVLTASFLLPFGLLILFCMIDRIAPFGDRTFLYDDMKRQYVDYFVYLKHLPESLASGRGSLFYSIENGLGGNMAGFFAYYLTSPLLVIFLFLPVGAFPSAVTFLTVTKLSLMSVTMCIYLKEKAGEYSPLLLPFSLSYALSANPALNCTNSMWLDAMILFPVLLLFADRFLNARKRPFSGAVPYILTTAALLYLNYYIAWMILLFIALWGSLSLTGKLPLAGKILPGGSPEDPSEDENAVWELPEVLKKALSFASSTILAGMLSAFLLLPAFFSLQRSAKNVPEGVEKLLF